MIPVTRPYFDDHELEEIKMTLDTGWVAMGQKVEQFEREVAGHEGVKFGVATTSCTTALHLALVASGLKKNMDVIVPAFTFVATANAVAYTGATPILVDICRDTYNIDVQLVYEIIEENYYKKDELLINKKTGNRLWGIVPVHQFGLCCDIKEINYLAHKYNIQVVEDAACALGAKIGERHEGQFGNISCLSFHPRKSITTGEGGMVLTDQEDIYNELKRLRSHGCTVSANDRHKGKGFLLPEYNELGYNYRMTDIQGAIGVAQIKKLDSILDIKIKLAKNYDDMLLNEIPELITPYVPEEYFHTYQSYVCILDYKRLGFKNISEATKFRNALCEELEVGGIATRQGTHAIHLLGYYKTKNNYLPTDFMNAYICDRVSISLPLYADMSILEQEEIIYKLKNFFINRR